MGNLESKIAEGEGKHTPAANNNKEINEIKIDTSNSTRRRDSVTTISSFVLTTLTTVGGVSLIGSSFINTGHSNHLGNITSAISVENIFSNSVILSVEITNLEDNDGELHIENRFFSKIYPLQEGVNEIHCTGLSDRTTYNVEVIVKDTIISKTNFKTTIEKEMTLNRW